MFDVEIIANSAAARMSDHGSSLSTYVYLMLKLCTRFPRNWWIRSNIALEVGFTKVLGLAVIPHSVSIIYFLNLWPINSDPWSYVISIGLWYLVSHVVSTKFVLDIALLSSYFGILNHPVTGFIMVTVFKFKFYLCTFLHMT